MPEFFSNYTIRNAFQIQSLPDGRVKLIGRETNVYLNGQNKYPNIIEVIEKFGISLLENFFTGEGITIELLDNDYEKMVETFMSHKEVSDIIFSQGTIDPFYSESFEFETGVMKFIFKRKKV